MKRKINQRKSQKAIQYHQAGEFKQASRLYQKIIQDTPLCADAHHLLGIIYAEKNALQLAQQSIEKAIQFSPKEPIYYNSLGNVYRSKGNIIEAMQLYHKSIELNHQYIDAMSNLACGYIDQKDYEQAIKWCKQALELEPKHINTMYNLAVSYAESQQTAQAIDWYQKLLSICPNHIQGLNNLANIYQQLGEFKHALTCYQQAINYDGANADLTYNLAQLYIKSGDLKTARTWAQQAVSTNSQHLKALYTLGLILIHLQEYSLAEQYLQQALTIDKNNGVIWGILAYGRLSAANWSDLDNILIQFKENILTNIEQGIDVPLDRYILLPTMDNIKHQYIITKSITQFLTHSIQPNYKHRFQPHNKIKIGYLSPDFHQHSVGLLIQDLFSYHNRSQFEIIGYDLNFINDDTQKTIQQSCDHYVDLTNSTISQAVEKIYADGIHVLVDLAGQTKLSRPQILAARPAWIQCQTIGDSGTQGADYIDYCITHKMHAPPEMKPYFTEKLAYIPEMLYAVKKLTIPEICPLRSEYNLPSSGFVYACFSNVHRICPQVFSVWMQILKAVPNSVLWLQTDLPCIRLNMKAVAISHGISPERIIFSALSYITDKWQHRLADLYLDPFSMSSGTCGYLSAQAGLPVLTMAGKTTQARLGAALAISANVPEMIAYNVDEYINKAVTFANQNQALLEIKNHLLTANDLPLFNQPLFVKYLERAYQRMVEQFQHDIVDHIEITPD